MNILGAFTPESLARVGAYLERGKENSEEGQRLRGEAILAAQTLRLPRLGNVRLTYRVKAGRAPA